MKIITRIPWIASVAALSLAVSAHANLVQDPDFSTFLGDSGDGNADFTNWVLEGNTGFDGQNVNGPQFTGETDWEGGAVGSVGYQDQTLTTVAGGNYSISFWIDPNEGSGYGYQVIWGGKTVFQFGDPSAGFPDVGTWTDVTTGSTTALTQGEWQQVVIDPMASTPLTDFDLGIRQDPGETFLTGLDVEQTGSTGVPDTASTALLLGGSLLLLAVGRRRILAHC